MTYLLRRGHKVDGGVVAVVLLREAEGKLVVDEEGVCFGGRKVGRIPGGWRQLRRRKV